MRPLRFPVRELKKLEYARCRSARDCCNGTAETSASQARSGVAFAVVSAADSSPLPWIGVPALRADSRVARASLNTTRQHPNSRDSAFRCSPLGYARYRYRFNTPAR